MPACKIRAQPSSEGAASLWRCAALAVRTGQRYERMDPLPPASQLAIQCLEKKKKKSGIKFWNLKVRFLCVCSAGVPGGAHGLGTPGGPGPSTLDIHIFPSANLTLATLKAKRVVVGTPQLAGFMWKCLQIH